MRQDSEIRTMCAGILRSYRERTSLVVTRSDDGPILDATGENVPMCGEDYESRNILVVPAHGDVMNIARGSFPRPHEDEEQTCVALAVRGCVALVPTRMHGVRSDEEYVTVLDAAIERIAHMSQEAIENGLRELNLMRAVQDVKRVAMGVRS